MEAALDIRTGDGGGLNSKSCILGVCSPLTPPNGRSVGLEPMEDRVKGQGVQDQFSDFFHIFLQILLFGLWRTRNFLQNLVVSEILPKLTLLA